jgi:hypothetical protein
MKTHVKRVLRHIKRITKEEELPPMLVAKQNAQADADTNKHSNNEG